MVTKGIPWDDLPTEKARMVAVARPVAAVTANPVTGVDTVTSQYDPTMPISERNLLHDGTTYFQIYSSSLMWT